MMAQRPWPLVKAGSLISDSCAQTDHGSTNIGDLLCHLKLPEPSCVLCVCACIVPQLKYVKAKTRHIYPASTPTKDVGTSLEKCQNISYEMICSDVGWIFAERCLAFGRFVAR